jgi:hypothetical protein
MTKNIRDLYRSIIDIKKGCQTRIKVVNDEKDDLFTDSYSIFARWRKHFSHLLNVHVVSDVRQTEIQTAEPLVPQPSALEVEMAIVKLKRHKSPYIDQSSAELIKS